MVYTNRVIVSMDYLCRVEKRVEDRHNFKECPRNSNNNDEYVDTARFKYKEGVGGEGRYIIGTT